MTQALDFIVAGGGIGGLAAASLLAQDGHRVTVLEQAAAFGEIGAGIQLGPNIFRMFDYLGLTEAVTRVAFFPEGLGMNDVRTGEKVVRVPLGDTARAAYGCPYGVIYRADLHDVFLASCRAQTGITLRTSARVSSRRTVASWWRARDARRRRDARGVGADRCRRPVEPGARIHRG